jgi:hypothetical protein
VLYTPEAMKDDVKAEITATSRKAERVTLEISALEVREAIRRWC